MLVRLLMQAGKACSRKKWAGGWCDGFSSVHPLPACSMEAAASALQSVNRWGESSLPWCTTNLSELHIMVTTPTSSVDCSFLPAVRIQNKKSTRD
jgi:hypothetical protein